MNLELVRFLSPEIILVVSASAIFVGGTFTQAKWAWSWLGVLATLVASAAWASGSIQNVEALPPAAVSTDSLSVLVRGWSLLVGGLFVLVASRAAATVQAAEVVGSILLITAGMSTVGAANDMVLLFAGLELISIPTYLLLFIGRRDMKSHEAAQKYFFLSILSSALFLYGLSFLYGISGSTSFTSIRAVLSAPEATASATTLLSGLAMIFLLAGLGFRIAAVPFHFYAPDVYQGTNNPNAGLLSVVPKVAGLVAMIRLFLIAMPSSAGLGWRLALVLAVLTMTLGNTVALWQTKIRRMLAFSSIAHAGYLLVGMTVAFGLVEGGQPVAGAVGALLLYLLTYLLATIGAFAVLSAVDSNEREVTNIDDLAGLGTRHPMAALCLAICMFSLSGVPPLMGFLGKLGIFTGAVRIAASQSETMPRILFWVLAIAGIVNAAIGAVYYLRVVEVLYFRPTKEDEPRSLLATGPSLAALVTAGLVVALGCFPTWTGRVIQRSADPLFPSTVAATNDATPQVVAKAD